MNQATVPTTPIPSVRRSEVPPGLDRSRMRQPRLIGALFLVGFLVYGAGSSLVTSLVGGPGFLGTIAPLASLLALGAFLLLLVTAVDIAKAILFFPILERHSKRTALTYYATLLVEVVFLAMGAIAIFLIVPLSRHAGEPGARTLAVTLVDFNNVAYQVGELTLGVGATFLCALLFRTRLVPRWIAVAGLVGYPFLVVGTIAELFGVHIGLYLTMPGTVFELALPVWLFIKGFDRAAFAGPVTPFTEVRPI